MSFLSYLINANHYYAFNVVVNMPMLLDSFSLKPVTDIAVICCDVAHSLVYDVGELNFLTVCLPFVNSSK